MALTRITKGVIKPNENYDTHNINSTGIVTAVGANFTGNVSVGGTLTYEDVTSIDSVGIITAQSGIVVSGGEVKVGSGVTIESNGNSNFVGVSSLGTGATGAVYLYNPDADALSGTTNDIYGWKAKTYQHGLQINSSLYLSRSGSNGLQLSYNNATGSYITALSGFMRLGVPYGNYFNLYANDVYIKNSDQTSTFAHFQKVSNFLTKTHLYSQNQIKLSTEPSGISVVGTTTSTQLAVTGISTFSGDIKIPTSMDSTESGGVAIQRFWSTGTITNGNVYKCGRWNEGEAAVQLLINVRCETGGHSGTATYLWQGGFQPIGGYGVTRLFPLTSGNGHGDGPDDGLNTGGFGVLIKQYDNYTFEVWVYVPSGKSNKALKVAVTELNRGNNFTDISASAAIPSVNAGYHNSLKTTAIQKLYFKDNHYAYFGDSQDLKIYHSGSSTYIDNDTGWLSINTATNGIEINKGTSEYMGRFIVDGAVELYHNNSKKFETTSTGATITGTLTASHTGTNQIVVKDSDTSGDAAHMRISFQDSGGTEKFFVGNDNSNGWLYLGSPSGQNNNIAFRVNGGDKFQVNASGAYVNGALTVNGNVDILDSIIHTGDTNTKIRFPTNDQISFETGGSEQMKIAGTNITLGTNATSGHVLQIKNRNVDSQNTNSLGLDIQGAWMRIGDGFAGGQTYGNGMGIKFHDSGVVHWSIGKIGSNFYISNTSNNGTQLFPSSRTDALVLNSGGNATFSLNVNVGGNLNVTGTTALSSTVTIPDSIVHDGDTDTKIRFPTTDQISFETGGSERGRFDNDGNFLVGTTGHGNAGAGARKLVLSGSSNVGLTINSTATSGIYRDCNIYFGYGTSVGDMAKGQLTYSGNGDYFHMSVGNTAYTLQKSFRLSGDGTVRFDSTPTSTNSISLLIKSHKARAVNDNNGIVFRDANDHTQAVINVQKKSTSDATSDLVFRTSSGQVVNTLQGIPERLRITGAGNIGLNVSTPQLTKGIHISKAGAGQAPNTYSLANEYMHFGYSEYNPGGDKGLFLLGFGYVGGSATNSPAYMGFNETSTGSFTYGDLVFATRGNYNNGAPTQRIRIKHNGAIDIQDGSYFTGDIAINAADARLTNGVQISKGGGSGGVSNTYSLANEYLHLGAGEYNGNGGGSGLYAIGFGYVNGATNSPAYIGFKETNTGSVTKGELVFATRDVVTNTAPTERLRIHSDGSITQNYANPQASSTFRISKSGAGVAELRFDTATANTASLMLGTDEELIVRYGSNEKVRFLQHQGVKMKTNAGSGIGYQTRTQIYPYWTSDTGACRFNITMVPSTAASTPRFWIFTNAVTNQTGTVTIGMNGRTNSPSNAQWRYHQSMWQVAMYGEGDNEGGSMRYNDSFGTQKGNATISSGGQYYVHYGHSEYNTNANQYQNLYGGWYWHVDTGASIQAHSFNFDCFFSFGGDLSSYTWYAYVDD